MVWTVDRWWIFFVLGNSFVLCEEKGGRKEELTFSRELRLYDWRTHRRHNLLLKAVRRDTHVVDSCAADQVRLGVLLDTCFIISLSLEDLWYNYSVTRCEHLSSGLWIEYAQLYACLFDHMNRSIFAGSTRFSAYRPRVSRLVSQFTAWQRAVHVFHR